MIADLKCMRKRLTNIQKIVIIDKTVAHNLLDRKNHASYSLAVQNLHFIKNTLQP